jgi:predicted nucleic acid-binding protein
MILLDTDHLSVFTDERDARHALLNQRLEAAAEQVACTIVSVEEVFAAGWP